MKRFSVIVLVGALTMNMGVKSMWTSILVMTASIWVIIDAVMAIRKERKKKKDAKR